MAFPFLTALAPVGASLISGLFSKKGGEDRNRAASAQAQRQMDFQERMSSTAHRREVTDLRAAGLNPILSATGGRGAASPGGAQAPVQDVLTPAISSAMAARRLAQEVRNMKATELTLVTQAEANSALSSLRAEQEAALAGPARLGDAINAITGPRTIALPSLPKGPGLVWDSFKQRLLEGLGAVQRRAGQTNPVLRLKNLSVAPPVRVPTGGGRGRPGGR